MTLGESEGIGMSGLAAGARSGLGRARRIGVWLLVPGLLSCATPAQRRAEQGVSPPGRIAALRSPGPPTRVVLISVAGLRAADFLTPDGYVAGDADPVRMPRLARLAGEGVIGEHVSPPAPGSSYASHASIATGRLPARHGVVGDSMLEKDASAAVPFWDNRMMKGDALWDAAIGRGVMALSWPTTLGARVELLLPEAAPSDARTPWLDFMANKASPPLMQALEVIAAEASSPSEDGKTPKRDRASWPTPAEKDAALARVACQVASSERDPGLWLIRMSQTEAAFGSAGSGSREVAAALGRIDAAIGSLVDCLETAGQLADTAIFVVGDVVYRPVHTRVDPNVALVNAGLVGRDPRSSIGVRSWLALVRSHGRSAYVYAKDARNAVTAREALEAEAKASRAFHVVAAAELARAGVDPQAWFGLEAEPGFVIGNGLTGPLLQPSEARASAGGLGLDADTHDGVGLVAWGRGIRSRVRVPRMALVDIAPTIAMLLGLRLEEPIDGIPLAGILKVAVPPPPPGPKRIGVGMDGDRDRMLQDMGGGR